MGITTIAGGGEVGWSDAISHGYGISELFLGQELGPVYWGGYIRQPSTYVLSSLDGATWIYHQI
jgi:hypothetical protein